MMTTTKCCRNKERLQTMILVRLYGSSTTLLCICHDCTTVEAEAAIAKLS